MIRQLAAIDASRGLAKAGVLPWHLPGDTTHYRQLAFAPGSTTLMGYVTYLQVKHLLGDCQAYVVTNRVNDLPDAQVVTDINAFLKAHPDVWIIGGASVFEQTLARAAELYLTEIQADFDCDQFYPAYEADFELSDRSSEQWENDVRYTFNTYHRRTKGDN